MKTGWRWWGDAAWQWERQCGVTTCGSSATGLTSRVGYCQHRAEKDSSEGEKDERLQFSREIEKNSREKDRGKRKLTMTMKMTMTMTKKQKLWNISRDALSWSPPAQGDSFFRHSTLSSPVSPPASIQFFFIFWEDPLLLWFSLHGCMLTEK